jgi:hypothetical protein
VRDTEHERYRRGDREKTHRERDKGRDIGTEKEEERQRDRDRGKSQTGIDRGGEKER